MVIPSGGRPRCTPGNARPPDTGGAPERASEEHGGNGDHGHDRKQDKERSGLFLNAADGARALELAKKEKVGLFLVDWNIPKLDGLEFIKTLRRLDAYKTTPMIMVTSEAARYNVMEAIAGGVTDYIIKPITGEVLWEKVSPYLEDVDEFEEDLANEG